MVVFLVTATLYLTCTGGAQYEYYHNIAPITVVDPPPLPNSCAPLIFFSVGHSDSHYPTQLVLNPPK